MRGTSLAAGDTQSIWLPLTCPSTSVRLPKEQVMPTERSGTWLTFTSSCSTSKAHKSTINTEWQTGPIKCYSVDSTLKTNFCSMFFMLFYIFASATLLCPSPAAGVYPLCLRHTLVLDCPDPLKYQNGKFHLIFSIFWNHNHIPPPPRNPRNIMTASIIGTENCSLSISRHSWLSWWLCKRPPIPFGFESIIKVCNDIQGNVWKKQQCNGLQTEYKKNKLLLAKLSIHIAK